MQINCDSSPELSHCMVAIELKKVFVVVNLWVLVLRFQGEIMKPNSLLLLVTKIVLNIFFSLPSTSYFFCIVCIG